MSVPEHEKLTAYEYSLDDLSQRILRPAPDIGNVKSDLARLCGMLTNMVKAVEARPQES